MDHSPACSCLGAAREAALSAGLLVELLRDPGPRDVGEAAFLACKSPGLVAMLLTAFLAALSARRVRAV